MSEMRLLLSNENTTEELFDKNSPRKNEKKKKLKGWKKIIRRYGNISKN
jgi:hypothetical protein